MDFPASQCYLAYDNARIAPEAPIPLPSRDPLLLLTRSLLGFSLALLMSPIVVFRAMSFWAQPPYDPAHPTPVGNRSITYHTAPFIGWCLNHGYLSFFANLAFNTIFETKCCVSRPGSIANIS